ncbi:hypothetical protein [Streptomyces sp. NPDC020965]|uniref:hypothetical protein n=1 Tax=Streptomyces sp. NPDC020965 TaxID=3365105 RepID=UPI0037BA735F
MVFSRAGAASIGGTGPLRALLTRCVVVLVAVAGITVAGGGGSSAGAAPVAPQRAAPAQATAACSGRPVRTVRFATGELRVYKNSRYACAVTLANRPGARRAMSVSLQPRGGRAVVESGRFTRQAGPVTVHALSRCVRASGKVSGVGGSTGWILC